LDRRQKAVTKDTYEVVDRRHRDKTYDEEKAKALNENLTPASLIVEEKQPSDEEIIKKYSFVRRMLNSHLLIHLDAFKYRGRIIIPEKQKHRPTKGLVVKVADDIADIKVGDRVVISQYAGFLLKFENTPVARTISYSEVIFIIDQNAPNIEEEGA
jgi:co-chaperonin GroES (HSP10)